MALLSPVDPIASNLFITDWSACWVWHQRRQRTRQEQLGCQAGRPGSSLSYCWSAVLYHTGSIASLLSGSLTWWMCLLFLGVCGGDGLRQTLVSYTLITAAGTEGGVTTQNVPKEVTGVKFYSMNHRTQLDMRDYTHPPLQKIWERAPRGSLQSPHCPPVWSRCNPPDWKWRESWLQQLRTQTLSSEPVIHWFQYEFKMTDDLKNTLSPVPGPQNQACWIDQASKGTVERNLIKLTPTRKCMGLLLKFDFN